MTALSGRLRLLLAALIAATGLLMAPAASAQEPATDCTDGIFVHVVDQGVPVVEGCAQGETAMARLLELTTVQTAGQGFVCQIADRPERCDAMPAGDTPYWSYWWWQDGEWVYATVGASYRGEPGSIEAWHYAPGEPPPVTPATAPGSSATTAPAATATAESSLPGYGVTTIFTDEGSEASDDGLPDWAPTATTAAILGAAALGYLAWHRSRKERAKK